MGPAAGAVETFAAGEPGGGIHVGDAGGIRTAWRNEHVSLPDADTGRLRKKRADGSPGGPSRPYPRKVDDRMMRCRAIDTLPLSARGQRLIGTPHARTRASTLVGHFHRVTGVRGTHPLKRTLCAPGGECAHPPRDPPGD